MNSSEIVAALEQQERDSAAYWNAFGDAAFFQKIGSGWSPAETVRHLAKSTRAVAKALGYPKILLRLKFGRAKRASMSYDELVAAYRKKLDEGGQAGRFAPSPGDKDRTSITREFTSVQRELRTMIARWPEQKLDRIQLPHPLLGNLTVREMLMFTLYHQRHHMDVIKRKLAGS